MESAPSVEVPADHDVLTWLVPYATSTHRGFAVGRDGKTAYERNVGRGAVPSWHSSNECGGCLCSHPTLDSRFEQGRYLGPMDGSNTVLVGAANGVVKARTTKRLPPSERWTGSLLNEALGSELTPSALEDDGGGVGIRAPVLQPHAAVPLPPVVPEFRQVRRASLRRADFVQFGYTDNCPGSFRTVSFPHGSSRDDDDRRARTTGASPRSFCSGRQGTGGRRPQRKRHHPEGEGKQPLAPPGEGSSSDRSSGSALPPAPLAQRSLDQETEMTDATLEQ